ncbi:SDR family oxidoreductase [Brevundimonas sp. 2R-24]|uniref:SDR family oxidoreductase n=1 Tax=Peiella sedimenti TaxID=3061083 RepID=A0ABT8SJ83_9CAUL|nr:SDR family oxidoreductase [Caulobacteraceae bacterium XZ-24]
MTRFTAADVPDQTGRLIVITGANSGVGFEAARVLAAKGAEVVIAARNARKAEEAITRIRKEAPGSKLRFEELDLSRQASVRAMAARLLGQGRPIDVLINNAGVMALPTRQVSEDGFELQLATNYLGHFALTGLLLPLLKQGQARTVQLSSIAHRQGRIHLDDLQIEQGYRPWKAYAQSKLAMLMFALELDRRSRASGWGITSVAAHPGYARTALIENGPLIASPAARTFHRWIFRPLIEPAVSHPAADGALPILLAATSSDAKAGRYYGATRLNELKGPAGEVGMRPWARDEDVAVRLWRASEDLTGVKFD